MIANRPSMRELHKKITEAKAALHQCSGLFANPSKAVGELYELNVLDTNEVWILIQELLEEISIEDYAGCKPPQKSYEETINGEELFAFTWWSKRLSRKMYIKFALKQGRYYYVSLHASRGGKNEMLTM
jgi:hypothetical protein